MSLLTPLYALGLLAISAPIIFHLIRRSPRGEVPFSSLMFLSPTPPRLTRRSRLDNILLLILRALALGLLAFAFARPFLRQTARLDFGDVERRRIAVMIDTSASMRRGNLWSRAQALARQAIADCRPADQLALFAFDEATHPLLGFDESATLDPAKRRAVAEAKLAALAPTWGSTHLGQALIDAVGAIEDVADASEKAARMPRRVVLIGDLQQGSRLEALGDFEWPSDVELDLKTVEDDGSNAGLDRLADPTEGGLSEEAPPLRVRVANDPGSRRETFTLRWVDEKGNPLADGVSVYVPPGESRVARVPHPTRGATRRMLRLEGDTQAFDNTLFFTDERREQTTILAVAPQKADDPTGILYYFQRVFVDTPRRTIRVVSSLPSAPLELNRSVALVLLAAETTPENVRRLKTFLSNGGTVLDVVVAPGRAETLAALAGVSPWEIDEARVNRDTMLGEIAFDHPLFAPFAAAQFNDFTKIHFWKYRHIDAAKLGDARVAARFENGDPAVIEKPLGKGRLIVLASGWQPADSQLARSSKFVPLMSNVLEGWDARPIGDANLRVHGRVPLPAAQGTPTQLVVHKPDGTTTRTAKGAATFGETDEPGVYTIDTAAGPRTFAVNLDALESKTSPLHVETLEQLGCRLANHAQAKVDPDHLRQLHNVELENRQKLWRWLIVAAIGVLVVETWLAGRLARPRSAPAEALTA